MTEKLIQTRVEGVFLLLDMPDNAFRIREVKPPVPNVQKEMVDIAKALEGLE